MIAGILVTVVRIMHYFALLYLYFIYCPLLDPNEAFAKWQLLETRYQREKKLENEQPKSEISAYAGRIKADRMFMELMSFSWKTHQAKKLSIDSIK
jgi:hypothetical protein